MHKKFAPSCVNIARADGDEIHATPEKHFSCKMRRNIPMQQLTLGPVSRWPRQRRSCWSWLVLGPKQRWPSLWPAPRRSPCRPCWRRPTPWPALPSVSLAHRHVLNLKRIKIQSLHSHTAIWETTNDKGRRICCLSVFPHSTGYVKQLKNKNQWKNMHLCLLSSSSSCLAMSARSTAV